MKYIIEQMEICSAHVQIFIKKTMLRKFVIIPLFDFL